MTDPHSRTHDVLHTTSVDRPQITDMTSTAESNERTVSLFTLLDDVSTRERDRASIVRGAASLSFGDLTERARAMGMELDAAGLQPGDRVAVVLPNGPEFAIAAFAIWKIGAILLPLHVRFQEDEILKYVVDCDVRAIVTNVRMGSVVQSIQKRHPSVAHAWLCSQNANHWQYHGTAPSGHAAAARPAVESDWPALTQYSTGSTGVSKRVTRSHQQLIAEYEAIVRVLRITSADRILGVAPFFHNYGLMNAMICGVLSGATVYAMDDFYPRDVARLITRERITGFPGVPFMHQLLADMREIADFSCLRYVLSAGAPLSAQTSSAFKTAYGITIHQLYGSTETGVISISPPAAGDDAVSTVGVPIPGVDVRIVDDAHHLVPAGVEGHVSVTSAYAASSYDRLEGKSESYFRDATFFPGDLGRIDAEGRLVLTGRKRQFINVAGNKVDPAEVETVLRELPTVSEAVVLGVPDGAAGEKIKAVLVTSAACSRQEVLEHCTGRLANFKCPRVVEFRKEIPKSPLGKILRKYLVDEYDGDAPKYVFDPRSGFGNGRAATTGAEPPIDLAAVPPFLRVLLVTDGTVTKNLEAYFWEPIDVELLFHDQLQSDREYPVIHVKAHDPVVKRRVVLRGRMTGSAYAFAETVIASDGLSADLRRSLIDDRKGIGELLRARQLETYREIVSVAHAQASEWASYLGVEPTARVMVRAYTIHLERRPAMQIVEVFPEALFQV